MTIINDPVVKTVSVVESQFEKNEPQYVIEQIEIHRYAFLCVYFYDNFFSMWFKRIFFGQFLKIHYPYNSR
jgi:hypothetical protein